MTCPACGAPGALVYLHAVRCPSPACRWHDPERLREIETELGERMAGLLLLRWALARLKALEAAAVLVLALLVGCAAPGCPGKAGEHCGCRSRYCEIPCSTCCESVPCPVDNPTCGEGR